MKEIRGTSSSSDSEVANSIMAVGKYVPTPGKELILPEGEHIQLKIYVWFTRSERNFVRRAFFGFFMISVVTTKFPAYIKETEKRSAYQIFYATFKQALKFKFWIA